MARGLRWVARGLPRVAAAARRPYLVEAFKDARQEAAPSHRDENERRLGGRDR